jgi:phenylalanyl-tRNA synthetase beta chain
LLRLSLLPEIWKNITENAKHFDAFRLFEIGREIHKQPEDLPNEITHLVAALYNKEGDGRAGLFEMKRVALCLLPDAEARPTEARRYEHPARAAEMIWRGQTVGRLFELHPSMVEGRAAILDIDLCSMESLAAGEKRYTPIGRYPSSAFDLSVICGLREQVGKLQQMIAHHASLLESIEYLRQYSGPPLQEGQKSVSFRITLSSPDHTLSSEEVSSVRDVIIAAMKLHGYELRV